MAYPTYQTILPVFQVSFLKFIYGMLQPIHDQSVRHHDMTRLQVADGGTASNMEGGFEYIE